MAVTVAVIVDNSLDSAAAGAALLLKYPEARVFISSAWNLPSRLLHLLEWEDGIRSVYICGIGCKRSPQELADGMKALKSNGIAITWCQAGTGWPECDGTIRHYCTVKKVESAATVTDAVIKLFRLAEHPRIPLLREVSAAGRSDKVRDREAKIAAELTSASMYRFFQTGDREAYPLAVRKLAGLLPIGEKDLALISRQRALGFVLGPDGSSPQIKEIRRRVALYAALDCLNVLILGETGTGKEKVARLLHRESQRSDHAFVAVNCANLAGTELLESRLFGHRKGSFTGATEDQEGIIEVADGGTLFLDEIADMPLDTQAKLLRVIEDGTYTPLGPAREKKADVRVVAATNRELSGLVRDGRFRIDLYYRLRELVIRVPPLRERMEDIGQIAGSVKRSLQEEQGRRFPDLTDEQIELLKTYPWPGNVRQLHSVLRRAYLLGLSDHLAEALRDEKEERLDLLLNLPPAGAEGEPQSYGRRKYDQPRVAERAASLMQEPPTLREQQREYAMSRLRACGNNLTHAARELDISVNTLKKLKREADGK